MSETKSLPKRKLENVLKGYAEVYYPEYDRLGFVRTNEYVSWTDFEKDVIHKVDRWETFLHFYPSWGISSYENIGRNTGYRTRTEALEALDAYVVEHFLTLAEKEQSND